MTSFCRCLLQRLAFSKLRHFSWDKDPANTMAYCIATTNRTRDARGAVQLRHHQSPLKPRPANAPPPMPQPHGPASMPAVHHRCCHRCRRVAVALPSCCLLPLPLRCPCHCVTVAFTIAVAPPLLSPIHRLCVSDTPSTAVAVTIAPSINVAVTSTLSLGWKHAVQAGASAA